MRLPVDIPGMFRAAGDIRSAVATPLAVSVLIDATAPLDLMAHVCGLFESWSADALAEAPADEPADGHADEPADGRAGLLADEPAGGRADGHARHRGGLRARLHADEHADADVDAQEDEVANAYVSIGFLGEGMPAVVEGDDMVVIVAGLDENIGAQAAYVRACGLPVMVVSTTPRLTGALAAVCGNPIPDGDLVAPCTADEGEEGALDEVIALDDAAAESLDARMGEWIIATRRDKRLAFALAFPFVRRPLALDSVNATALENAGIGLVPFIRGADMTIMTLNQAKMILQIAAAYGKPLDRQRIKELAAVVGGGFACRGAARTIAGFVPVLGWAVRATVGFTGTQAMGRSAIDYFEAGGDFAGVLSVVRKTCDEIGRTAVGASHAISDVRARVAESRASAETALPEAASPDGALPDGALPDDGFATE